MTKRKIIDESIDECKRFREEEFPADNSRSDHEKRHLLVTNNDLSEFVRKSVEVMVYQRDEIENLNQIINQLRNSLATSESKNFRTQTNMDVI